MRKNSRIWWKLRQNGRENPFYKGNKCDKADWKRCINMEQLVLLIISVPCASQIRTVWFADHTKEKKSQNHHQRAPSKGALNSLFPYVFLCFLIRSHELASLLGVIWVISGWSTIWRIYCISISPLVDRLDFSQFSIFDPNPRFLKMRQEQNPVKLGSWRFALWVLSEADIKFRLRFFSSYREQNRLSFCMVCCNTII